MDNTIREHGGDIYTEGKLKGRELIDFSANINPLGIPESFKESIQSILENAVNYPDLKYRKAKENIKTYLGIENSACEIILGNGAAEIIDLSLGLLNRVCIVVPSFGEYKTSALKYDLDIEYSYLNEDIHIDAGDIYYGRCDMHHNGCDMQPSTCHFHKDSYALHYDYEDILRKMKHCDGLIIGNPNNPNGGVIDKKAFQPIIDFCEENSKLIIIDEAFVEFTGEGCKSFLEESLKYSSLLVIRAVTKFFALPGIRLGYGITTNSKVAESIRAKQLPWNINTFAEASLNYIFTDKDYIKSTIDYVNKEKNFLTEKFRKIQFIEKVYESNGNFVLLKLKGITDDELFEMCLEKDILIRRCGNYEGLDHSFIRIAVKDRKSNEKLISSLKNIYKKI